MEQKGKHPQFSEFAPVSANETDSLAPEAAALPTYLGHWNSRLGRHQDTKAAAGVAARNLRATLRQRHSLIHNNEELPPGRDYYLDVKEWYCGLGAFNDLFGGEGDLLKAYDLLRLEEHDFAAIDPKKAFLGAMLLHEAALLSADPQVRQGRLERARNIYLLAEDFDSFSYDAQYASRLRHDAIFESLADHARLLEADGFKLDSDEFQRLKLHFALEQLDYIEDFNRFLAMWEQAPAQRGMMAGRLFEMFSLLAYRHLIWQEEAYAKTSVRAAFLREDIPHDNLKDNNIPRQSFDILISHFQNGVETGRVPIQIKVNGSGSYTRKVELVRAGMAARRLIVVMKKGVAAIEASVSEDKLTQEQTEHLINALELIEPEHFYA